MRQDTSKWHRTVSEHDFKYDGQTDPLCICEWTYIVTIACISYSVFSLCSTSAKLCAIAASFKDQSTFSSCSYDKHIEFLPVDTLDIRCVFSFKKNKLMGRCVVLSSPTIRHLTTNWSILFNVTVNQGVRNGRRLRPRQLLARRNSYPKCSNIHHTNG